MCDYGKLTNEPCENESEVNTRINDKNVQLCPIHSAAVIENLIKTTGMKPTEQTDLIIEILYGELKA